MGGEETQVSGQIFTVKKLEPVLVRPASQTDDGFYFLSNLDQTMAFIVETLYCFRGNATENAGEVMREALAKVLVHYYPLAGCLVRGSDGKLVVKCAGEGVEFVEAFAEHEMEFLGDTTMLDPVKLKKLVHKFPETMDTVQMPLLTVQVTRFRCGGFVLGIAINHCIADGISATDFINSWAETARGLPITNPQFLDRTILRSRQPPNIISPHHEFTEINDVSNISALYQEHQIQYKSFIFKQEQLLQLKQVATEGNVIKNCSTFAALSAFIWHSYNKALGMGPTQETRLLFTIDGRSRFNPPLPKGYFGNGIIFTHCSCSAGELLEKRLSFAVRTVQEAIKVVTEDHLRSLIDHLEVTRASYPTVANNLLMSEWSRLSFSSTDFGWGTPSQFGPASPAIIVLLLPHGMERKCINVLMGLPAPATETFQELICQLKLNNS